jgi:hypothetical protein
MQLGWKTILALIALPALATIAAYFQWIATGLPALPAVHDPAVIPPGQPFGFPAWVRLTHFVNFLFLVLLVRSGLQILADHPRLYWNLHCTPGTEWARFTSIKVPSDRLWTAKEDSRYLSP